MPSCAASQVGPASRWPSRSAPGGGRRPASSSSAAVCGSGSHFSQARRRRCSNLGPRREASRLGRGQAGRVEAQGIRLFPGQPQGARGDRVGKVSRSPRANAVNGSRSSGRSVMITREPWRGSSPARPRASAAVAREPQALQVVQHEQHGRSALSRRAMAPGRLPPRRARAAAQRRVQRLHDLQRAEIGDAFGAGKGERVKRWLWRSADVSASAVLPTPPGPLTAKRPRLRGAASGPAHLLGRAADETGVQAQRQRLVVRRRFSTKRGCSAAGGSACSAQAGSPTRIHVGRALGRIAQVEEVAAASIRSISVRRNSSSAAPTRASRQPAVEPFRQQLGLQIEDRLAGGDGRRAPRHAVTTACATACVSQALKHDQSGRGPAGRHRPESPPARRWAGTARSPGCLPAGGRRGCRDR